MNVYVYKALKPVFQHLRRLGFIAKNPMARIELDRPQIQGFRVADAEDIAAFQERWPIGKLERLVFDLALYTGAARGDLAKLGRKNIKGDVLIDERHKSKVTAYVLLTRELRAVITRTPDIVPTFILNSFGCPFAKESLGNLFGDAVRAAGMSAR